MSCHDRQRQSGTVTQSIRPVLSGDYPGSSYRGLLVTRIGTRREKRLPHLALRESERD